MFAVPSFFGYNTTFVSTPVATAATGVGETSFTANWDAFTGATYYLLDVSTSPSFSSFVLQDEVVMAPTTSYVVIGLTASTTYYYRLRASTDPYIDPDASAFFARVTAAGGTLSATEQTATNQLVLDMKAAGVWTKMKAVYPMVGGGTGTTAARQAACEQNLVSSSFTGTFTSGWTFASTGVTPNGTSAYMDTGLNVSTNLSLTNTHLSYYSRTNVQNSNYGAEIGVLGSYSGTNYMILRTRNSTSPTTAYFTIGEDNGAGISSTDGTGLTTGSATSLTSRKLYKNSSLVATQTTSNTGNLPNLNAAIGMNVIGSYGSNESSFASIGDGLTDTQAADFYTCVQTFQTTLSRQV